MGIQQPKLVVLHQAVSILQVGPPRPHGFHFRARQNHARLKLLQQKIIVRRRPVLGRIAISRSCGIPFRALFCVWLRLMSGLPCHGQSFMLAQHFSPLWLLPKRTEVCTFHLLSNAIIPLPFRALFNIGKSVIRMKTVQVNGIPAFHHGRLAMSARMNNLSLQGTR